MMKSAAHMTGQAPPSRGKRKLDFSSRAQPLRGKVFFLDLPSQKSLADIEQELTQRGGVVEKFFDKKVGYLITNRHRSVVKTKATGCSPLTLSPDIPEGVCSPFLRSPAEGSKPKSAPVTRRTRAGTILDSSKNKQKGKKAMTLIEIAREWGTKILSPNELMAELKRMKTQPLQPDSQEKSGKHYKVPSVRELRPPFMKVEDQSGSYRPLIYETDVWPLPDSSCPPNTCPYDQLKRNGKVTQMSRATGARLTQELAASLPGPPVNAGTTAKRKPGYCECCALRYEDLKMHLQSKKHRDYATNASNFASLDQFAANKGMDHKTFLESLREKYTIQEKCSVDLITPPGSPVPMTTSQLSRAHGEVASPAGLCLANKLTITAGFTSPKRGALCLTPIKISGKRSPIKISGKGSSITTSGTGLSKVCTSVPATPPKHPDGILGGKRLRSGTSPTAKRRRPHPLDKRRQPTDDIVPETPEKRVLEVAAAPSHSPLCNIQKLVRRRLEGGQLDRAVSPGRKRGRKVQVNKDLLDEVTRDSPLNSSFTLSPGTSPLTRKSPRLLRKPHPKAPPTPTRPISFVLSIALKDIHIGQQTSETTPSNSGARSSAPEGVCSPRALGLCTTE